MSIFELPTGYPDTVVDEWTTDNLVAHNIGQLDDMLLHQNVREAGVDLRLVPTGLPPEEANLATALATLERFRTFVNGSETLAYPDVWSGDKEVFWKIQGRGISPVLFVTENHISNPDGTLAAVTAHISQHKPEHFNDAFAQEARRQQIERVVLIGQVRKRSPGVLHSLGASMFRGMGWLYPGLAYRAWRESRQK